MKKVTNERLLPMMFLLILCTAFFAGCDQSSEEDPMPDGDDVENGAEGDVTLRYQGEEVALSFADFETEMIDGVETVSLADIVQAGVDALAAPPAMETLVFDFEADDGFRSSCVECEPLTFSELEGGHIITASSNIFYDEALGMSGCYRVKGFAAVLAFDEGAFEPCQEEEDGDEEPVGDAVMVNVEYGEQSIEVDLGEVEAVEEGSMALANLADVYQASDLLAMAEDLLLEIEASDGYIPASGALGYEIWSQGTIDIYTGDIVWPETLEIEGCYRVKDVAVLRFMDAIVR